MVELLSARQPQGLGNLCYGSLLCLPSRAGGFRENSYRVNSLAKTFKLPPANELLKERNWDGTSNTTKGAATNGLTLKQIHSLVQNSDPIFAM